MDEEFFLFLTYQGKKLKFKINSPNDSLTLLMEKVRETNKFDMPSMDPSGAPLEYYFGKTDDTGQAIILNPKLGKTEMYLEDYNVENGDALNIVYNPIPGAGLQRAKKQD